METTIKISFIILLSLVLLTSPIDGRKDPKDYWEDIMKGQSMPEALKNFINERSYGAQDKEEALKEFIKVFDPIPNISAYHDDAAQKEAKSKKQFAKKFEPIPNISAYQDDEVNDHELADSKKQFSKEFKPIPNISAYDE